MRYTGMFKFLFAVLPLLCSCVYEFDPADVPVPGEDGMMLVVEGDIIAGGITQVSLSYTTEMFDYEYPWEWIQGASVWVENEAGEVWGAAPPDNFADTSGYRVQSPYGYLKHRIDTRDLPLDGKYRLCISIPDRGEYVSSFKPVQITPPIDSVTCSVSSDSLQAFLEVTSHGSAQETGRYKWIFRENWNNSPDIVPDIQYVYNGDFMADYTQSQKEAMMNCFGEAYSSGIIIASTEDLSENLVYRQRVAAIDSYDKKVKGMYCISVVQMSLDEEGYAYWESMKKNTTGMGGLFDPQPSEVNGNISSVINPGETVIGYINVCTLQYGRLFVDWDKVDIYDRGGCWNVIMYPMDQWRTAYAAGKRPVYYGMTESGGKDMSIAGWVDERCVKIEQCVGKPSFWPL